MNTNINLVIILAQFMRNFFSKIKEKNKLLELGVANGHSLASWYKYFENANIYGIDLKKKSKLFYKGKRLNYFSVDITNNKAVKNFLKKKYLLM